jgi:hypothetical protein
MKNSKLFAAILSLAVVCSGLMIGSMISGCAKDEPLGPVVSTSPTVDLAVSFSKPGTGELSKSASDLFVDSLHIDSAVVVFSRIQFLKHEDTVQVDTGDEEDDSDHHESDDGNDSLTFKGPFAVHVRDSVSIDFASRQLPAGVYDGIRFKIHRLTPGEHFEDSDEHMHHDHSFGVDSTFVGSSITVWGSIYKNGAWTPFTFKFDGEFEFKIKGNFTVPTSTSTVRIALNIDMGAWFINPRNGSLLDPTDRSFYNLQLFRRAIRSSFQNCRGGHDRGDGHPDD